ncbi:hypothetical protein lerEdw1_004919 [Lerista edwardsae]|nr:hypothetical protein lerEdw1_004920 [Lerista edwardsae]KAJ6650692.1 hypothetical protein lerEdw1_004919 [Lerista edwardsae]
MPRCRQGGNMLKLALDLATQRETPERYIIISSSIPLSILGQAAGKSVAAMKPSMVALLVAIVCVERARSFSCYSCENEHSESNCIKTVQCAETDKYCFTTTRAAGPGANAGFLVNKGCSRVCADPKVNVSLDGGSTECCNVSLCNVSGATSVKTSTALMALGIVASLLCAFRSGL